MYWSIFLIFLNEYQKRNFAKVNYAEKWKTANNYNQQTAKNNPITIKTLKNKSHKIKSYKFPTTTTKH
jgi:hypothetical protein